MYVLKNEFLISNIKSIHEILFCFGFAPTLLFNAIFIENNKYIKFKIIVFLLLSDICKFYNEVFFHITDQDLYENR